MRKLDKREINYIVRTIMPELYKRQAVVEASLKEVMENYFREAESKTPKASGE